MSVVGEAIATVVGALLALDLGVSSGRTHGWTLVAVVVMGALVGASVRAGWHGHN